jgi:hypothetical protein
VTLRASLVECPTMVVAGKPFPIVVSVSGVEVATPVSVRVRGRDGPIGPTRRLVVRGGSVQNLAAEATLPVDAPPGAAHRLGVVVRSADGDEVVVDVAVLVRPLVRVRHTVGRPSDPEDIEPPAPPAPVTPIGSSRRRARVVRAVVAMSFIVVGAVLVTARADEPEPAPAADSDDGGTEPAAVGVLRGQIEIPDGAGPSDIVVTFVGRPVGEHVVDAGGAFDAVLPRGRYQLVVSAAGHLPYRQTVIVGEEEVAIGPIELARGGAVVRGIVRDATGAPIAGAAVSVLVEGDPVIVVTTNARGAYDAQGIEAPGRVRLRMSSPGLRSIEVEVSVSTSDAVSGIDVILQPE